MKKRNNGIVTETAHLHTDLKKYGDNYDKIFGKKTKEMELNFGESYLNVVDNKVYTIVSFITDKDTDKNKVLYCNEEGEQFTRLPERFRQKFKKVSE